MHNVCHRRLTENVLPFVPCRKLQDYLKTTLCYYSEVGYKILKALIWTKIYQFFQTP